MPAELPSARSFAVRVFLAVAIIAGFAAAWWAADVLLLVFGGTLFGIMLSAAQSWVAHYTHWRPSWSLSIVLAGLLIVVAAGTYFLGSRMADQADTLSEELPKAAGEVRKKVESQPWGRHMLQSMDPARVLSGSSSWLARITGVFSSVVTVLADVVVILFIGIYLAVEPDLYRRGILAITADASRKRVDEILITVHAALEHWLIGKLALMAFVGVFTAIGLAVIGVPLVFTLALLAALLDFIPNIGPLVSAIPAIILALPEDPMKALWVALLYLTVQFVESYILAPIVQRRAVSLPPALLISAQLFFGVVFGPLGLIFATPLTVAVLTSVRSMLARQS